MATGDVVTTRRADRYHVEIRHPDGDWNHIHPPTWERTTLLTMARHYAARVKEDHPDSEVRIIRTRATEVTKLGTRETTVVDLGTEVVDH